MKSKATIKRKAATSNAEHVRNEHERLLRSGCSEAACAVILPSGDIACVCGNSYQANERQEKGTAKKLCDCLVYWSHKNECLAVVELKGGGWNGGAVMEQLQRGADVAKELLGERGVHCFRPVLAHNGGVHPMETRVLFTRKINFPGLAAERVRLVRCGHDLKAVFS